MRTHRRRGLPNDGTFFWWSDAMEVAARRAARTGRRQRVRQLRARLWVVQEVDA